MIGRTIGPYHVVAKLGEGGMGEVYRATDTDLRRDVAIKVLPDRVAADPERLARFQREAQVLASLNHPNIAHIYGVEKGPSTSSGQAPSTKSEQGVTHALVMELVPGPTLADRIAQGPIPVVDALPIARQVAEALEAAHEQGIVHRDLKPANVKVRDDGTVKVLDFGLAKAMEPASAHSATAGQGVSISPTITSPAMTAMGMILGTAAYMSPEQARGKTVDRRADVWAFGVVLFEMLTGRRLFARDEVSDTLAAVLTVEPDLTTLPPVTPAAIRRLLARCLAKDRRQRLDSMAVARLELEDAQGRQPPEPVPSLGTPRRGMLGASVLVAAGIALGAAAVALWPRTDGGPAGPSTSLVAEIPAPPDTVLAFYDGFALSPDGRTLAFAARTTSGLRQIWLRALDAATAQSIAGTENGAYPFWSPDGRSVAFFADYKLKRVNVDGSGLQTICEVPDLAFITGSWGTGGDILWATNRLRIFRVPASGGTPVALDALGEGTRPYWLPDGRRFLYSGGPAGARAIRVADAGGTPPRLVLALDQRLDQYRYAFGGGLLFFNKNDALVAQRLDENSGTLVGSPAPIALDAGWPKTWFAVSSDGRRVVALVRRWPGSPDDPTNPVGRLTWVDRQGRTVGTLGDAEAYWTLNLAPDGESVVVNLATDLWLLRKDGRRSRFTDSGLLNLAAVWAPSGQELIFSHYDKGSGRASLVRRGFAPGAEAVPLGHAKGEASDWSPDGRWLLTSDGDIHLYNLANDSSTPWLATRAEESHARFSPDGRWVTYTSNAGGRVDVYVRQFEGGGQPIPVSTTGGDHPIWRRDGRELFFLSPGNDVMSVDVTASEGRISLGQPQKLFSVPLNDVTREYYSPYDVAPDGQRFLMNLPDRSTPLFLLQGLDALVGRK